MHVHLGITLPDTGCKYTSENNPRKTIADFTTWENPISIDHERTPFPLVHGLPRRHVLSQGWLFKTLGMIFMWITATIQLDSGAHHNKRKSLVELPDGFSEEDKRGRGWDNKQPL